MNKLPSVTVVLLAYKEAENLKVLLPQIQKNMDTLETDYNILVVDTTEPLDETPKICAAFGALYHNQEAPGFGGAMRTAIKYADKDLFLILDSDGSHNPDYIPDMYRKFTAEQCDVVIGSRYTEGGKTFDAKSSILMSRILNTAFRIALGIKAKDISTDFRLYHTSQLKQIELINVNYDVLQEILLKLKMNKLDLKIGEVPITFEKRMFGESKRQLLPFIWSYIKSLVRLTLIRFPVLRNLVLYGLIGGAGAVIDYLLFFLTQQADFAPELSNIIGAVSGFLFTFSMNTFLNFKKTDQIFKRFCSYGFICIIGASFSTLVINLFKETVNVYFLKGILLVVVSLLQFMLNRLITFRR